jgi:hypothetical protein
MINDVLIYIDDQLIDLPDRVRLGMTFQFYDVGAIQSRFANYTNRFEVPKTNVNKTIFGNADRVESLSLIPYKKLPARIVLRGKQIVKNGLAIIKEASDVFQIEIYSNTFGFFDAVGEKTLDQLNLREFDYYSGAPDTMIKYPWLNYSFLDPDADTMNYKGSELASMSYKTFIQEIFKQNGYEASGNILDDPKLERMYIAGCGFKPRSAEFTRPKEFEARRTAGSVFAATTTYQKVNLTEIIKASEWYDGTNTYTVEDPMGGLYGGVWFVFDAFALVDIASVTTTSGTVLGVDIRLFSNTGAYPFAGGTGAQIVNLEISERAQDAGVLTGGGPVAGQEGVQLYLEIRVSGLPGTTADIEFNQVRLWNKVLDTRAENEGILYIDAASIAPQIKQKDLLRDFFTRFGVIAKEGPNSTMILKTVDEVIVDKHLAVDWTNKRDSTRPDSVGFDYRAYEQNNYFKYNVDDDDLAEDTGEGIIVIDNEQLAIDKTIYSSIFQACATSKQGNETSGFIYGAFIPVFDDPDDENGQAPGLRLVMIRDRRPEEPEEAGGIEDYEVAYFIDPAEPYDCGFQDFIDAHYKYFSQSLQRIKAVTRFYYLTPDDIEKLDQHRLVYDHGAYYLLEKVKDFKFGNLTQVNLFKVV